jgi:hypothetical protein
MPNIRGNLKHPALQHQYHNDADLIMDADAKQLETIPGWETFNPMWKRVLSVLPWFANPVEAYRHINPDSQMTNKEIRAQINRQPLRKEAFALREQLPIILVRQYGGDLMSLGMEEMRRMLMDESTTDANKLKIMEMLFKVNNVGQEVAPAMPAMTQNTFINIPGGRSAEPETIEATLEHAS